jgi:hypothetical protein
MRSSIQGAAFAAMMGAAACALAQERRAEAVVYEHSDFRGRSIVLDDAVGNFERLDFNDRVSSVRITGRSWEFCADARFRGTCRVLRPGSYANLGDMNDRVSSARPVVRTPDRPPGKGGGPGARVRIELFDGPDFRGRSVTLEDTAYNLERLGFNDRAESVIVHGGRWRLCSDARLEGRCRSFGPGRYRGLPEELRSKVSSVRLR